MSYVRLLNFTFSLAPMGRSPASFRFAETLAAGGIPVLIIPSRMSYFLPFEPAVCLDQCAIVVTATSLPGEINSLWTGGSVEWVRIMRDRLVALSPAQIYRRQETCARIYHYAFKSPSKQVQAMHDVLAMRSQGIHSSCPFAKWVELKAIGRKCGLCFAHDFELRWRTYTIQSTSIRAAPATYCYRLSLLVCVDRYT